ncbi:MAG: tRNA (adenosine(37)-N6)-threonylcarbamoyltransferase complex ATPase subunit type 1 TsaE [Dissulfurispiraceae bacterium]|jgi:tRNA threonylcarbamoyladenosine biosynthesis protein TsaE|nr:tRNA (adenosine(37)-N6)-threonylcarbamoyltransferase complex ATPase subunit type 1 TsaE [Dissulfurispiraceae bacterium]
MNELRFISGSAEETQAIGNRLGRHIAQNCKGAVVCMYGDLGAGKTVFIKGIASYIGISDRDIGSASFVIVAEYETEPVFYHIDLYRIDSDAALDELGIWEYLDSDAITVIEWAERLGRMPEGAFSVEIKYTSEDEREIIIKGTDIGQN